MHVVAIALWTVTAVGLGVVSGNQGPALYRELNAGTVDGQCVRVATTAGQQRQGLQGQRHPGVLAFSWPRAERPEFWMVNTPVPLTLAWVEAGYVEGLVAMRPESRTVHEAPVPVTLAVEYPSGSALPAIGERLVLGGDCAPGEDQITFPPERGPWGDAGATPTVASGS